MNSYTRLISMLTICVLFITGCASKFAPVVSRPDNMIISCTAACNFNVPMNTEVIVARNTNGYDMAIAGFGHIPFIGALVLGWKSMDVAQDLGEMAIDSFNRGSSAGEAGSGQGQITDNSTTNIAGDTTITGDTISSALDSSGSGNFSSADVGPVTETAIGGDAAGGSINKSEVEYTNSNNPYEINNP